MCLEKTEHCLAELKMTLDNFRQSLTATEPPAGLTLALSGLWWDAKGDWTRAHESAQQDEGTDGSWVIVIAHRQIEWFSHHFASKTALMSLPPLKCNS